MAAQTRLGPGGAARRPARTAAAQASSELPVEMSLLRIVAQGLVPHTAAATPAAAVANLLAVQGQQVSAIPHAIMARTPGASRSQVEAAFQAGQLVRSWPLRATIHVTTAQDHHWLRETLRHRDSWERSRVEAFGWDDSHFERAAQAALALLAQRPQVAREDLNAAWEQEGLLAPTSTGDPSELQAKRRLLLIVLHAQGVLVQGPRAGNDHLILDARSLPPASTGVGGAGGVAQGQSGHEQALAEVARRYAAGHGPVTAADLARWSALPVRQSAQVLEAALEASQAGPAPLARMRLEGKRLVGFAPKGARELNQAYYLRADLPDLLAQHRQEANRTIFLGAFDELHVGYKDRTCLTDAAGEKLICPAKNGVFAPLVVDRGRVVAVRPSAGLKWAGGAAASARVEKEADLAIAQMLARLG